MAVGRTGGSLVAAAAAAADVAISRVGALSAVVKQQSLCF